MDNESLSDQPEESQANEPVELVPLESGSDSEPEASSALSAGLLATMSTRLSQVFEHHVLLWSFLSGSPFVVGGGVLLAGNTPLPTEIGYLPLVIGLAVWAGGIATEISSPPNPRTYQDESVLATTTPTKRVATIRGTVGMTLVLGGVVIFFDPSVPLAYPVALMLLGLYAYATGMVQFWINSLTRYYLTSQRFIQSYRLLSVRSKAIPLSRIQATQESQTAMERLFGIGHVVIESAGESSASRIRARAIKHPYALAESLQSEIRSSEQ